MFNRFRRQLDIDLDEINMSKVVRTQKKQTKSPKKTKVIKRVRKTRPSKQSVITPLHFEAVFTKKETKIPRDSLKLRSKTWVAVKDSEPFKRGRVSWFYRIAGYFYIFSTVVVLLLPNRADLMYFIFLFLLGSVAFNHQSRILDLEAFIKQRFDEQL